MVVMSATVGDLDPILSLLNAFHLVVSDIESSISV